MTNIIIAIGSNYNQNAAVIMAQKLLSMAFNKTILYSCSLWTKPVGKDLGKFLNCLGFAQTSLSKENVIKLLKELEVACGNTEALRNEGKIVMDIDLLLYGHSRLHIADWQRDYVKELMRDLLPRAAMH